MIMNLSDKKNLVDKFIKDNNPYRKNEPLHFDLRAYSSYVQKNNLSASQITPQILERFKLKFAGSSN